MGLTLKAKHGAQLYASPWPALFATHLASLGHNGLQCAQQSVIQVWGKSRVEAHKLAHFALHLSRGVAPDLWRRGGKEGGKGACSASAINSRGGKRGDRMRGHAALSLPHQICQLALLQSKGCAHELVWHAAAFRECLCHHFHVHKRTEPLVRPCLSLLHTRTKRVRRRRDQVP